jgi:hypothetical protein
MLAGAVDPLSGKTVTPAQFIERLGEARRERQLDEQASGISPPLGNQAFLDHIEALIGTSPEPPTGSGLPSSVWGGGPSVLLGGGAGLAAHQHLQLQQSQQSLAHSASLGSLASSAGGMSGDAAGQYLDVHGQYHLSTTLDGQYHPSTSKYHGQYHPSVAFGTRNPKSSSASVSLYTNSGAAFQQRVAPVPKGMSSLHSGSGGKEFRTVAEQVRSRTDLHKKKVAAGLAKSDSADFRGVSSLRRSASMASTGVSSSATTAVPRPLFRNESGLLKMTPSPSFVYGGRTSGVSGFA